MPGKRDSVDVGMTSTQEAIAKIKSSQVKPSNPNERELNDAEMRVAGVSPDPRLPANSALHTVVSLSSLVGFISEDAIRAGVKQAALRRPWMSGSVLDWPTATTRSNPSPRTRVNFAKSALKEIPVVYSATPQNHEAGQDVRATRMYCENEAEAMFKKILNSGMNDGIGSIDLKEGPLWKVFVNTCFDDALRLDEKGKPLNPQPKYRFTHQCHLSIIVVHWLPVCDAAAVYGLFRDIMQGAWHFEMADSNAPRGDISLIDWRASPGNLPELHKIQAPTLGVKMMLGRANPRRGNLLPEYTKLGIKQKGKASYSLERRKTHHHYRHLENHESIEVYQYAHFAKVSVHAMLVVSMAYAVGRSMVWYQKTKKLTVMIEVAYNMRERLKGKSPKMNFSDDLPGYYTNSSLFIPVTCTMPNDKIELPSTKEWWYNCQLVHRELEDLQKNGFPEAYQRKLDRLSAGAHYKKQCSDAAIMDKHLGRLVHGKLLYMGENEESFSGTMNKEMHWSHIKSAHNHGYANAAFCSIVNVWGGRLHFTTCSCEEIMGDNQSVMVNDELGRNLQRAVAGDWPLPEGGLVPLKPASRLCAIM
jgi:hypothetical protein